MVTSNCLLRGPVIPCWIPNRWRTMAVTLQRCHCFQNSTPFWPGWARSLLHANILPRLWFPHGSCMKDQEVHSSQVLWCGQRLLWAYVPRTRRFLIRINICASGAQGLEKIEVTKCLWCCTFRTEHWTLFFLGTKCWQQNHFSWDIVYIILDRSINLFLPLSMPYQLPSSRRKGAGLWNTTIQS